MAALSFYAIADKSLWLDEAFSVALARLGWSEMWRVITEREANMGLYHVLLHYWARLGTGEFAVRALSAIAATLSIAPVYGIGARLFGVSTGIIAALLLALNAFFVQHAQEAKAPQPIVPSAPWGTLDLAKRRSEWLDRSPQPYQRLWLVLVYKDLVNGPGTGDSDLLPTAFQGRYCLRGIQSFQSIE